MHVCNEILEHDLLLFCCFFGLFFVFLEMPSTFSLEGCEQWVVFYLAKNKKYCLGNFFLCPF